jgi:tripartite-type tricarboxylate transporter receptor subunit TctC
MMTTMAALLGGRRLAASGSLPIGGGPEQLDAHIRSELVRWDRVLKAAGVQPN